MGFSGALLLPARRDHCECTRTVCQDQKKLDHCREVAMAGLEIKKN